MSNKIKQAETQTALLTAHYDALIDENNDPVKDPPILREEMNKSDGQQFIDELNLSEDKNILEIGVGTGRIALKVCENCKSLTGIDLSMKTIERTQEHLKDFRNVNLICGDFLEYKFSRKFDIIYSSLTFWHVHYNDKFKFIQKVYDLLNNNGRFVLSIGKSQDSKLIFGDRTLELFPDNPEQVKEYIKNAGFILKKIFETELAVIFVACADGRKRIYI